MQSLLLEKQIVSLFLNALPNPFFDKLMGNAMKNFVDRVVSRKMIESVIENGKIQVNDMLMAEKRRTIEKKEKVQAIF